MCYAILFSVYMWRKVEHTLICIKSGISLNCDFIPTNMTYLANMIFVYYQKKLFFAKKPLLIYFIHINKNEENIIKLKKIHYTMVFLVNILCFIWHDLSRISLNNSSNCILTPLWSLWLSLIFVSWAHKKSQCLLPKILCVNTVGIGDVESVPGINTLLILGKYQFIWSFFKNNMI